MASEDLGTAVLTLTTNPTQMRAGLAQAKQEIFAFRREADAAGKATSAAFKNAISPVSPQTSESFRKLFTDVRVGSTTSATAADKLRASFVGAGEAAAAAGAKEAAAQRQAAAAAEEHTAAIKRQLSAAQSTATAFRTVGIGMTAALTAPIVGMVTMAAKASMDFESSFAGVRKTVNATEDEFKEMAAAFRNLATTIPVNVNELNRLGEAAGALGIPKREIVDFARVMALLGTTTNLTSDQAAESIAKIQNIFNAAGEDTDRFAATLVALGNDGASTETQIMEMATRIAGAGNAIGLSQGQVLAFASALSSVGLEAEAGGSAISRVFIDIASSVSEGGDAVKGFAKVAEMSVGDFSELFRTDAASAVNAFIQGLGKIKTSGGDLLGTLEELGFTEIRTRDTLLRAAGAGDILTRALELQNTAWTENTALTAEADKRFQTTASQVQLLKNRLNDAAIELGDKLVPILSDLLPLFERMIDHAGDLIDAFGRLPKPLQEFAVLTVGLLAIGGPVMLALSALLNAWVNIEGAILAAKAAQIGFGATRVAGAAGAAAGSAAGGLTATGVAAAVAGALASSTTMAPSLSIVDKRSLRERAADYIAERRMSLPQVASFPDLTSMFGGGPKAPVSPFDADMVGLNAPFAGAAAGAKKTKAEIEAAKKAAVKALEEMKDGAYDVRREIEKLNDSIGKMGIEWVKGRTIGTGMGTAPSHLPIPMFDRASRGNAVIGVNSTIGSKTFSTGSFLGGLSNDLASSVPNAIVSAIQGGGSKMQAAGSALGMTLFGKESHLTKSITGMFSADGILGKTLSSAVPIIGSLIGPAMEGLGKLWGKLFGTAGRDAVRDFATKNGGFDALHQRLGTLGAEGEKLWKTLTQGVGRNNPEEAKAAIEKVTAAFEAQRQKVLSLQGDLSTITTRLSGLTSVTPGLEAALEAAFNAKTPEEYAAAMANIGHELDTIEGKQSHLQSTLDKYHISWTDLGEEAKKARISSESARIVAEWQELRDAGVGVYQISQGMGDSINDFVRDAKKAGVEVPESMRDIIQAGIDSGKIFDDNGVKITNIKDLGLTFGSTMQTVMTITIPNAIARLTSVLEGLARFLGIELPNAAAQGASGVQNEFDDHPPVIRPTIEWPDEAPPDYTGGWNDRFNSDGAATGAFVQPWGLQHFMKGGFVKAVPHYLAAGGLAAALAFGFMPRGTDVVPAMLTPGEGVVNRLGMSNLGIDGLRAYNRGEVPLRGGIDTSRVEAQLAQLNRTSVESVLRLEAIEAAVVASRVTSVQVNGRELVQAQIETLDNGGGILTHMRQTLGVG